MLRTVAARSLLVGLVAAGFFACNLHGTDGPDCSQAGGVVRGGGCEKQWCDRPERPSYTGPSSPPPPPPRLDGALPESSDADVDASDGDDSDAGDEQEAGALEDDSGA